VNEDKATRYHRLKRQARVISMLWAVLLLGGLTASGWSAALRDAAERIPGDVAPSWHAAATVLVFVVLLTLLNEVAGLPLSFYSGFYLERQYELSRETLRGWLVDQAKSLGLGLVLGGAAAELLYAVIRISPERWWLSAGITFTLLIVCLTNLAPVLWLPIFYSVKPLDRDALRARLLALAERAGARVLGAYEWGLGEKTRKANAALAGLGGTRRILVSDTMLA
jgi:STE24 endopeptidase